MIATASTNGHTRNGHAPKANGADRLPPQEMEAERRVLGSILRRGSPLLDEVLLTLSAEDFYTDAHQKIFLAAFALHEKRRPVDCATVADLMRRRGHIEDIGGYVYLAELFSGEPTGANALYYVGFVKNAATLRELIRVGTGIVTDAYDQAGPADDQVQEAEQNIFALGESKGANEVSSLDKVIAETDAELERRRVEGASSGIATGFAELDGIICGFQPGELTVIAARPSIGKTTFGVNILRNLVFAGNAVLFVSLEQNGPEIGERLYASESGVNSHALRQAHRLTESEWSRIVGARESLRGRQLFIADRPGQRAGHIASHARRLARKNRIALVLIDYLQLIESDDRRAPRHEQVGVITKKLRNVAKELRIPVVTLAQLNRESENRPSKKPRLADLRESGEIEQHADAVWLMHRPQDQPIGRYRNVEVEVAKNRNGQTGSVKLQHCLGEMRFENAMPI